MPTPPAEDVPRASRDAEPRRASPRSWARTPGSRRSACSPRSCSAAPSSSPSPRRSRSSLGAGLALGRDAATRRLGRARRASARSKATSSTLTFRLTPKAPVERLDLLARAAVRVRSRRHRIPSRCDSLRAASATLELPLDLRPLGRLRPRRVYVPAPTTASGLPHVEAGLDRARRSRSIRGPSALRRAAPAARDAGVRRQPGRAREGRGDRVRRPAAVRAG